MYLNSVKGRQEESTRRSFAISEMPDFTKPQTNRHLRRRKIKTYGRSEASVHSHAISKIKRYWQALAPTLSHAFPQPPGAWEIILNVYRTTSQSASTYAKFGKRGKIVYCWMTHKKRLVRLFLDTRPLFRPHDLTPWFHISISKKYFAEHHHATTNPRKFSKLPLVIIGIQQGRNSDWSNHLSHTDESSDVNVRWVLVRVAKWVLLGAEEDDWLGLATLIKLSTRCCWSEGRCC